MSKLFKLKEWLTLDETVQHLSAVLGESIQEKDIFRLVLDGHLRLSVNFVNKATVNKGRFIKKDEVEFQEVPNVFGIRRNGIKPDTLTLSSDLFFDEEIIVRLDENVTSIGGVWDLPLLGEERLDIEHRYQISTNGPELTLCNIEGPFVEREGEVCRIVKEFEGYDFERSMLARKEGIKKRIIREKLSEEEADELRQRFNDEYEEDRFNGYKREAYYPADSLPEDSVLVVRTSAILDLLKSLDGNVRADEKGTAIMTESRDEDVLTGSAYWEKLYALTCSATSAFPAWSAAQTKIQKSGNLNEWLLNVIGADTREAEIIKRILTDFFKELR